MDLSTISQLPAPQRQTLRAYAELLRGWAPKLDLISPRGLARLEERHLADSLKALPLVQEALPGPCVDVGSGAGLPGIPLAVASGRFWRLLEPRRRRAAFLEEAVRELDLDAEVVARSAEDAATDPALAGHSLATARALARPDRAARLCRPLVRPGGRLVLWVGRRSEFPRDAEEPVEGLASIVFEDD